ncbi:thiamine phosphate synthase [Bartonella sp. HY329]|uniref:thiamine phosphate synthase n=1 Tax=unclassified Bartonella TaxID=2645622 RepID=UPI0021C98F19|nr:MULTISPECIES: thiamine phosphate synthase [unclassified Bartonella]UXM95636.1 thiamine phosphate synthase [Bartonella sp. HY329]UXN09961.1 thiamine phosphate synthase [Bartonella sp. HY328]
MSGNNTFQRCRIVLALSIARNISPEQLTDILAAGDVASLILYSEEENESAFQKQAQALVPVIQNAGVAAIIAGDSRIAGRVKADGLHIETNLEDLKEAIEKHQSSMMVGFANLRDRHNAMQVGELEPDYMMFGKLGADKKPEAHSRNINLGEWWASLMEVPALIQAGNSLASIETIAKTGAEFIVLEEAIFGTGDMVANIIAANELLDEHAPKLGDNDE